MRDTFSIGEVSKMTGFTINALRHYDKIGLVKPAIVDKVTNYRYYSKDQLFLFDIIAFAKKINLPLEELKDIFQSGSMTSFKNFLDELKARTEKKIETLKVNLQDIDTVQEQVTNGMYLSGIEGIYQRAIPERDILISPVLADTVNNHDIKMRENLEAAVQANHLATTFETGSIYHLEGDTIQRIGIYKSILLDFNSDDEGLTRIPEGNYLCAVYHADNRDEVWQNFLNSLRQLQLNNSLIIEQKLLNDIYHSNEQAYELQAYVGEATE